MAGISDYPECKEAQFSEFGKPPQDRMPRLVICRLALPIRFADKDPRPASTKLKLELD